MSEPQKIRLTVLQQHNPAVLDAPLTLPDEPLLPSNVPVFDHAALRPDPQRALRTSSYTIYANLPDNGDAVLLIHGYTGAFDKVSRPVAAYLRSREGSSAHKPLHGEWSLDSAAPEPVAAPSEGTLQKLKKRGYLTQLTVEEEESFFTKMAAQRHLQAVHRSPGYILMPTYECNLRCPYCFQDHMRTDPSFGHLLRVMQPEMVDRWLTGMLQIEAAHGIPKDADLTRNITFFGGEPLLEESRPIIEYAMQKLLELGKANLSAITNGTDLHAYEDLLGPGKLSFLQITLDGPPAEHDKRRIYADGSGSFDRIARNIDMALARGVKISVRMNIDRNNIGLLPELGAEFTARGWDKHKGFSAYVAPIHAQTEETAKTTFNSWELNQALLALKDRHPGVTVIGGPDDSLVDRARRIFDKRIDPVPSFKSDFCSAHTTMYILDSFGDIYACWERTGDASLRIGAIDASGAVRMNRAITEAWRSRNVTTNSVCRKCRYASYCGGGCAVLAEGQNGNINSNFCDAFGKRFRTSAAKAYQDHMDGVEFVGNTDRVCDL